MCETPTGGSDPPRSRDPAAEPTPIMPGCTSCPPALPCGGRLWDAFAVPGRTHGHILIGGEACKGRVCTQPWRNARPSPAGDQGWGPAVPPTTGCSTVTPCYLHSPQSPAARQSFKTPAEHLTQTTGLSKAHGVFTGAPTGKAKPKKDHTRQNSVNCLLGH